MTLGNIKHVVTLMLENHSFDNVLGMLYQPGERVEFKGLSGGEANPDTASGRSYKVQPITGTTVGEMATPNPDPGEEWTNMNEQIFGKGKNCTSSNTTPMPPATMNGFVDNYLSLSTTPAPTAQEIMNYFTATQFPALHTLAKEFAVCDTWFASVPCQTIPNRLFLHAGQNNDIVNNKPSDKWVPFLSKTIFDLLEEKLGKESRRIYYGDLPTTIAFTRLWYDFFNNNGTFRNYDQFKTDIANNDLAAYTHIEPKYLQGPDPKDLPNDMHPPHHVGLADQLVAEVYNTLRNSSFWENTLLIITFDEHGGIYDHQVPPKAMAPSTRSEGTDTCPSGGAKVIFKYDRYGVRVPTVLISPYIKSGTILKPPATSAYPYDHTSVITTVGACFDIDVSVLRSDRVNNAPTVSNVLTLTSPRTDCPGTVNGFRSLTNPEFTELLRIEAPNTLQNILAFLIKVATEHSAILQEASGDIGKIADKINTYATKFNHDLLPKTRIDNFKSVLEHLSFLHL